MNIVHVGPSGLPVLSEMGGAVQRRMWELAREQVKHGLDVTIISPSSSQQVEVKSGVRIVSIPLKSRRPIRDYEFLFKARRVLAKMPPFDVLHAHGSPDASRLLGIHAKVSVQTVDYFRYRATNNRGGHAYYVRSLNRYGAIMPVSGFCERTFKEFYPALHTRVVEVPNGVDLEQFRPDPAAGEEARISLRLPPGPLVVYLGRVCFQKGSDLLGGLAESLELTHPQAHVVAVGPPDQFGDTGRSPLMEELALRGVHCTGAIHENLLRGVLNAATLVALPTRHDEMFGMAALEALACGTPVAASDLGGIPEAVGSGGALFPIGDAEAFHSTVGGLLDDPTKLELMREAARPHAAKFSWSMIASLTAEVYKTALVDG